MSETTNTGDARAAFQERLRMLLAHTKETAAEFTRRCNLSPAAIPKMSHRSHDKTFALIAEANPGLNIEWLRTGNGEPWVPVGQTPTAPEVTPTTLLRERLANAEQVIKYQDKLIAMLEETVKTLQARLNEHTAPAEPE